MTHKNAAMVAGLQHQQQMNAASAIGGVAKRMVQQQPTLPHYPPIPRVICPETIALRERRDEIRCKLAAMLQNRHHKSELLYPAMAETTSRPHERRGSSLSVISSPSMAKAMPSGQRTIPQSPSTRQVRQKHRRGISHLPLWQGPDPPPQLPRRRKTHWDTVLEEMRWMATDFIEERKWKHSTARMLGFQAVRASQGQEDQAASPLTTETGTKPGADTKAETESSSREADDSNRVEEVPMEIEDDSVVKSAEADTRVFLETLSEVTVDDVKASRAVAERVSGTIAELFSVNPTAGPFSQLSSVTTDGSGSVATEQQEEVSNGTAAQSSDPVSDLALHSAMSGNADASAKIETTKAFERASKHVDSLLQTINEESASPIARTTGKAVPETHGFRLSLEQTEIINTIEDRWQRIRAGAVLKGPVASGKTIATCSLLWRNKAFGPQLLVCTSASMVSVLVRD
jgi:HSA